MKFKVTNRSKNHRIVHTSGKISGHLVAMGQTAEIEMTEAEADNAAADGVEIVPAGGAHAARRIAAGKYGVFRGEARVDDATYPDKAAAQDAADALNAAAE